MPETADLYDRVGLRFTGIPMNYCPRCTEKPNGVFEQAKRPPVPVATSGLGGEGCCVRYVCPTCRLIWDTVWDMAGDFFNTGPFDDDLILAHEGLESHPTGEVPFPAGPKELLRELQSKRQRLHAESGK